MWSTDALEHLTEALSYVNLHHEKFYHCHDTLDRLKPYIPEEVESIELKWINAEGNNVTQPFIDYVLPLIQGEPQLPKCDSLPRFAKLKKVIAE